MASTFKRKAKPKKPSSKNDDNDGDDSGTLTTIGSSGSMLGLSGTKAWTGGTTLTSCGLRDMDGILGGGQPLGTCVFIEEDRWTQSLASTIIRYWCAEAVCQNQHLMIPTIEQEEEETCGFGSVSITLEDEEENDHSSPSGNIGPSKEEVLHFLRTLPFNLHWEKQQQKILLQQQQNQEGENMNASSCGMIMETLQEDDDNEEEAAAKHEEGLKIAWQYRKDVQQQRTGHGSGSTTTNKSSSSSDNIYCHSYDLSRQLSSQMEQQQKPPLSGVVFMDPVQVLENLANPPITPDKRRSCGFRLYQQLLQQVQSALKEHHPRKVIRLLLYRYNPAILAIALPLLLVQIRHQQLPVVVLICVQPWKFDCNEETNKCLINLHRASDVVLQVEGFAARTIYPPPPEFRHLHGLLVIRKVSTWTAPTAIGGGHFADLTVTKRPPANIYGLQRDRRKLHIPLLHIPPEDHTEGGGSVAGGGVRSGAGRPAGAVASSSGGGGGCGSGNSLLEF